MIEEELEKYVPYKAMVLEQVLVWTLLDIAQFHFKDSDSYLAKLKSIFANAKKDGNGFNKAGNYALREFERWCHIDSWLIDFICGRPCINGKKVRVANLIMSQLEQQSRMIHHVGKKNVTYTSGKTFSHLSFWFIDTRWVKGLFNNSKYIDHKKSDWYCEEAKYIISKIAYPYSRMKAKHLKKTFDKLKKIAEDKNMTKEEKAKLKEECEKGMHAFSYEVLVKDIEKREKTKLRTMQTRIRKMTQKAMAEIVIENEKLKSENSTLKQHVEELEAELKQYAEAEVPDDSISYSLDEQEKAVVEACEAELAKDKFDDTLTDSDEALVDEWVEIHKRRDKASDSATAKPVTILNDPKLAERIAKVKAGLQKMFDNSCISLEEAKLFLRAKFGTKLELDRPHEIDWIKYQQPESIKERCKLFKDSVDAINRGEWKDVSTEDTAKVRERHKQLEAQFEKCSAL